MREAIDRGWASYDSYSKKLTLNIAAIRANARAEEEGELAISVLKKVSSSVEILEIENSTVSTNGTEAEIKVKVDNREAEVKVVTTYATIFDVLGDNDDERAELLNLASELQLSRIAVALKFEASTEFKVKFENATELVNNPVVKALVGDKEVEAEITGISNGTIEAVVNPEVIVKASEPVTVVLGEGSTTPVTTSTTISGGGGGGCSVTPATPTSGLFNLGVLLSGLLGLFGFRRKKH